MCGRYGLTASPSDFCARLGAVGSGSGFRARYNIAPTQRVLGVLVRDDRERIMSELRWGYPAPPAAGGRLQGKTVFNARVERVEESPMFRDAFRRRRCVIPATGFFEWRRDGKARSPVWIHRRDGEAFGFAGVWSVARDPRSQDMVQSCAIVTCPADGVLDGIHDRKPAILDSRAALTWLTAVVDAATLLRLPLPLSPDEWDRRSVSAAVNSVRNEGPELIVPIRNIEQPTLFPGEVDSP